MITMEEFDKAQIILGKRGKPRPISHIFPFTGFIKCGNCGAQITASIKKKYVKSTNQVETYIYYHCTKRKKYVKCDARPIKVGELDEQIIKFISENNINPKFYKLGLEVLGEVHSLEIGKRQSIYENQQRGVEETQKKLDRAVEFLLNGTITEETYKNQKKELEDLLTKQKIKLSETEDRAQKWTELTENVFHFAKNAILVFEKGGEQTQKDILFNLGWNHELKDRKLFLDIYSWYLVLKKGEKELLPDIEWLELNKNLDTKRQKEAFASLHTRMCVG